MPIKNHLYLSLILAGSMLSGLRIGAQTNEVSITVGSEAMQEFLGLGFTIHKAKAYFLPTDQSIRNKLYSETFNGMNTVVFWSYIENPAERDQFISEALNHGLDHVIVNTTGDPLNATEHAETLFADIEEYMGAGYPLYGTTLMNKPNTDESDTKRQDPAFLTECAKLLRHKLDSAGYQELKIGGPSTIEWAPYMDPTLGGAAHGYSFQDGDNLMYLNAFLNDTTALKDLAAIDFQSYGWSVSNEIREIANSNNKELWVTLSATDGYQNDNGDPILATISSANCLANLNHGVSSWNHWVWDQLVNFNTGLPNTRMLYLQQIGRNFKTGARFRTCLANESQPTPDMFWNYFDFDDPTNYIQPEIVAAAAMNPDSTMTIAVVNLSGIHAQHFFSEYHSAEAKTYSVNLDISELHDLFKVQATTLMCQNDGNIISGPVLQIENGMLNFNLPSKNMAVLITEKIGQGGSSTQVPEMRAFHNQWTAYPNPFTSHLTFKTQVEASLITIRIYDTQGRVVQSLPQRHHSGGVFEFNWDATGIGPGIYIGELLIEKDNKVDIQKIKLIRNQK